MTFKVYWRVAISEAEAVEGDMEGVTKGFWVLRQLLENREKVSAALCSPSSAGFTTPLAIGRHDVAERWRLKSIRVRLS